MSSPAESSAKDDPQRDGETDVHGEPTKLSVAIIGGGIVGVILAHGLLHRGVQVAIYEWAPNFYEIGAGFAFTCVARECMTRLSPAVIEAMKRVGVPNKRAFDNYWDGYHSKHDTTTANGNHSNGVIDTGDILIGDPDGNSCELLSPAKTTNSPSRAAFAPNSSTSLHPLCPQISPISTKNSPPTPTHPLFQVP
jgi:hypothetical protein